MYIGLRTNRYGPRTTSRRGGSNGAGVPFPTNANVRMHHRASAAPTAAMTSPPSCVSPNVAGRWTPDHSRTRPGRNTSRKPMNSVAYVTARISTNTGSSGGMGTQIVARRGEDFFLHVRDGALERCARGLLVTAAAERMRQV